MGLYLLTELCIGEVIVVEKKGANPGPYNRWKPVWYCYKTYLVLGLRYEEPSIE